MDNTLKLTDTYWEMLKSLNDDIKLRLATRLTASAVSYTHLDVYKRQTNRKL